MHTNFYVYGHYTADTGEVFYIGKGKGIRYKEKSKLRRSKFWQNVVNKHGLVVRIIKENLSEEEAFELERKLIRQYGKRHNGTGCLVNLTDGGEGTSGYSRDNVVISSETRKKISEALTGRPKPNRSLSHRKNLSRANKGKKVGPFTEGHKHKISIANKGRLFSEEHRQKLSDRKTGTRRGKHLPETIEKIRLAAKVREQRKREYKESIENDLHKS